MWKKSPRYTIKRKKQVAEVCEYATICGKKNDRERIRVGIRVYEYVKKKHIFPTSNMIKHFIYTQLKINK